MTNTRNVIAPELGGFFPKGGRSGKGQEPLKWGLKILPTANNKIIALAVQGHKIHPTLPRHSRNTKASLCFAIADSQGKFSLTPHRRSNEVEGGRIKVLLSQEMLEQETTAGTFLPRLPVVPPRSASLPGREYSAGSQRQQSGPVRARPTQ